MYIALKSNSELVARCVFLSDTKGAQLSNYSDYYSNNSIKSLWQ